MVIMKKAATLIYLRHEYTESCIEDIFVTVRMRLRGRVGSLDRMQIHALTRNYLYEYLLL